MAYHLRALVAETALLTKLAKPSGIRVVELTKELSLLPLTAAQEAKVPGKDDATAFDGLKVSKKLALWAASGSKTGTLAYIEADYGAGKDYQAAVVWEGGDVSAGPWKDGTAWDPREDARERPVNGALRLLGVRQGDFNDEWDAVALARHIDTDQW
ncbi:hypothetical protein EPO15_16025 [bacterium]|nr:MAG: hypothetical protein EPO15_16025 [bacterium]